MKFWNKLWGKKGLSEPNVMQPDVLSGERTDAQPEERMLHKKGQTVDTPASCNSLTGQIRISLDLENKSYEANLFDIDFKRELNEKNEPDGLGYGGFIFLELTNIDSEHELYEWIAATRLYHDGKIRIYQESENGQRKALLFSIVFKEACCISYHKQSHVGGQGAVTKIKIAPHYLKIGNEEFENKWTN